jgi:hypothetical protein
MRNTSLVQSVNPDPRLASLPSHPVKPTPEVKASLLVDDHQRLAPLIGIMWGLALSCLLWITLGLLIAAIW